MMRILVRLFTRSRHSICSRSDSSSSLIWLFSLSSLCFSVNVFICRFRSSRLFKTTPKVCVSVHLHFPSQWFRVIRLHDPCLTRAECRAFSLNAHHHGPLPQQLKVVWSLASRPRGAYPHLLCSLAADTSNTCELDICRYEVLLRVS